MNLSVIVPAYNAAGTIDRCLEAILSSEYKDYELIVVNDGSQDNTSELVKKYPCKLIDLKENKGDGAARNAGAKEAGGEILVFIDSDIVIYRDSLGKMHAYFTDNPGADAVVGMLSKEHPNADFFSQYKNIYMNYIFSSVTNPVDFLFTSLSAVRKARFLLFDESCGKTNDTELGKRMAFRGYVIMLDKDLQVVHLKKYNLISFVKNDFRIPFLWAHIFLKYRSYKDALRKKKFAHARPSQLLSILLMPFIIGLFFLLFFNIRFLFLFFAFIVLFLLVNYDFFHFLLKEKGVKFILCSIPVTLLDMIVMMAGIACGMLSYMRSTLIRSSRFAGDIHVDDR